MEFNGLPVHPLIVHVVVVFAPLAGIGGILYAVVPRWRWLLRWPLVASALIAAAAGIIAVKSGHDLENQRHLQSLPELAVHVHRGEILRWLLLAFLVPTALSAWLLGGPSPLASGAGGREARAKAVELAVSALLVVGAIAVLVSVFLTGDAGARSVWGG
ncbi:MAG: hypothetical protein QM747_11830 [Nocardioides sp.]